MKILDLIRSKRFTVFLGKNGAGKSTILRSIDSRKDVSTRYISPERGGVLKYEPGIDNNIASNGNWLQDSRRQNRTDVFRQQSAAQFRNLEILFLREIERDRDKRADTTYTFDSVLDELNVYLPAIRLKRSDRGFSITSIDGTKIDEAQISSGESEFIALAIELLVYSRSSDQDKTLLLDEPDVHLHPDLQSKFVGFIEKIATTFDIRVVIATHSTAIISAFSINADLQIAPITNRQQVEFDSFTRDKILDELLPVFGAHPLSSLFNKAPIVLVEGEDDKRVLEQLVRSSQGRVRLSPCPVGTVTEISKWERWLETFLPVIYDEPQAFSLRDGDKGVAQELDDLPHVVRCTLNCYAIENLLLTDEALARAGSSPEQFKSDLYAWAAANQTHPQALDAKQLVERFGERRWLKVKELRNVIMVVLGQTKPWEVYLGQLLAETSWTEGCTNDTLSAYLGLKFMAVIKQKIDAGV